MLLVYLALLFGLAQAQRPSNASICDYYAEKLYGTNNSDTQARLIQGIVALAYAGGSSVPNATNITGILNPGVFNGLGVNLEPWFNGSMASTNLEGQAVEISWIDQGIGPLEQFLNGSTPTVELDSSSNEFLLFTHFFEAFSGLFGCTVPPPSDGAPRLNLAYVHKFMNLNQTDVGHFIDQFSQSIQYHGFSAQDVQTFNTQLNSEFNVRCAPPINGQVSSLCQASSCPLAEPSPDCEAYVNLGPNGTINDAPASTSVPTPMSSAASSSIAPLPTTSAPAVVTIPPSPKSNHSSSKLATGAIAGIVIGSAAVFLLGVAIFVYFFRRPNSKRASRASPSELYSSTPGYVSQTATSYTLNNENHGQRPRRGTLIPELESPTPMSQREMGDPGKSSLYTRFISDD